MANAVTNAQSGTSIHPSNAMETWYGIIRSLDDALRLVEAARTGVLPRVTRRLTDDERANLIRSGSVFIFEETEAQVRRWADSRLWSSSRMKGHFLLYTQLAHDPASGGMASTATPPLASPPSSRRPSDTSVHTTSTGSPSLLDDDKHLTPPPEAPAAAAGQVAGDSDDGGDDELVSGSGTTTAPGGGPVGSSVTGGSTTTRNAFKKRALSLSTAFGQKLRLISYYTEADAAAGRLPTIDQDDRLAQLAVPENLYYAANDTPVALSRRSSTRLPTISGPVLAPQASSMPPSVVAGHGFPMASHHDAQHLPAPHLVQAHPQAQALAHYAPQPVPGPRMDAAHAPPPPYYPPAGQPPSHGQDHMPPQVSSPTYLPPAHGPASSAVPAYPHYGASPPPPPGPLGARRPSYSPTRPFAHPYVRPAPANMPDHHQKAATYPPTTLGSGGGGTRSRSGSVSSMLSPPPGAGGMFPGPLPPPVAARGGSGLSSAGGGGLVLPPIRTLSPTYDALAADHDVPYGGALPDVSSEARQLARAHPDARYAALATSEDKRQLRALDAWRTF